MREMTPTVRSLYRTRDVFWFTLGAYALLTEEPSRSQLAGYDVSIANNHLQVVSSSDTSPPGQTGYKIGFRGAIDSGAAKEVVERAFRQMILTSYATTTEFVKHRHLQDALSREDWYPFARHYRNAIAHNGRWNIAAPKGLPTTWRNLTIEASFHNRSIDGFLGWFDGLQLCAVMIIFVSQFEQ
jgi:hypothetical protein